VKEQNLLYLRKSIVYKKQNSNQTYSFFLKFKFNKESNLKMDNYYYLDNNNNKKNDKSTL